MNAVRGLRIPPSDADISADRAGIVRTQGIVQPFIRRTPVIEVQGSEFGLSDFRLTLKLELFQHAGSFKSRGAFANLLMRRVPEAGVVAASGGNHGAAVAYAARQHRRRTFLASAVTNLSDFDQRLSHRISAF
jgi:threonine dehydratase